MLSHRLSPGGSGRVTPQARPGEGSATSPETLALPPHPVAAGAASRPCPSMGRESRGLGELRVPQRRRLPRRQFVERKALDLAFEQAVVVDFRSKVQEHAAKADR